MSAASKASVKPLAKATSRTIHKVVVIILQRQTMSAEEEEGEPVDLDRLVDTNLKLKAAVKEQVIA
jgi:hypothetical protein